ncbi:MAG: manganese efflux pump [Lachnospiraceae bacterium]|nr:manganese efflux pump [Lachnospiraceae bacterium]MDD7379365.1 manganese efflux pump [Lachnospiraceae bacterium]MDY4616626.1 manganese efflux pump [Lachnospiraceae bacterium]
MNMVEIVLITIGVSWEIFATLECQGALVAKLEKKRLALAVILTSLWQTIALFVGCGLVSLLKQYDVHLSEKAYIGKIIAVLILGGMGLRLFVKAWKNERIIEKREEGLDVKKTFFAIFKSTIFTVLTGIAFGFLQADLCKVLIMIICVTVAMVIIGLYTGYRMGYEQKTKAYFLGGLLLIIAGIDVIIRYIVLG